MAAKRTRIPNANRYTTAENPCSVCGSHSKGCSRTEDGLQLCRGDALDSTLWTVTKPASPEGFISYRPATPGKKPSKPRERSEIDWLATAKSHAAKMRDIDRVALAEILKLPVEALSPAVWPLIGVAGAESGGLVWSFAEFDGTGETVVGVKRRFPDGSKKLEFLAAHGLTIPTGFDRQDDTRPLFVVEGASDTIAATFVGLAVVGRPSNTGGVEFLSQFLATVPASRSVIIVGENDLKDTPKPDGSENWPGRDGAISVASRLATALNREILWTLPPVGTKDVRAWLTNAWTDNVSWEERGRRLAKVLTAGAVTVAPGTFDTAAAPSPLSALPGEDPNPAKWDDDPDSPRRLARGYLATLSPPGSPLRLRYWRDEFHEWSHGVYRTLNTSDFLARLGDWLDAEMRRVHRLALTVWESTSADTRGPKPKIGKITRNLASNVLYAIESITSVDFLVDAPCWLDDVKHAPNPSSIVSLENGLLDLKTMTLSPPSSSYFNFSATPFHYQPDAPAPANWLKFLADLWPSPESADNILCLQEWFGYLLTPDTCQQKLLFVLGPKRAGKGTIARILRALVGPRSYTGPTLSSLAGDYGLWPLIGKSVAVISDARLSGKADTQAVVERILSVTGEDTTTINRKNLPMIDAKLSARFVIMSNELPNLTDASGALASRMILLKLSKSHFGEEDTGLTDRLLQELPGVLNWAVEGYHRLRARGRFIQPADGAASLDEMHDIGSPVAAFVKQECIVSEAFKIPCKELFDAWKKWCEENGRREANTTQIFSRNLTAAYSDIRTEQARIDGQRVRRFIGIKIKPQYEYDPDSETPENHNNDNVNSNVSESKQLDLSDLGNTSGCHAVVTQWERSKNGTEVQLKPNDSKEDTSNCHAVTQYSEKEIVCARENSNSANSNMQLGALGGTRDSVTPQKTDQDSVSSWLYFSAKLDFEYLPPTQTQDVIVFEAIPHYRLTPETMFWAELAGERVGNDDAKAFVDAFEIMSKFVRDRFSQADLERLRTLQKSGAPVALPELPKEI